MKACSSKHNLHKQLHQPRSTSVVNVLNFLLSSHTPLPVEMADNDHNALSQQHRDWSSTVSTRRISVVYIRVANPHMMLPAGAGGRRQELCCAVISISSSSTRSNFCSQIAENDNLIHEENGECKEDVMRVVLNDELDTSCAPYSCFSSTG